MPSSYTALNRQQKIFTTEQIDTWGVTEGNTKEWVDQALDGILSLTVSGTVALTYSHDNTDQAHYATIITTGSGGTIHLQAVQAFYVVENLCSSDLVIGVTGSSGTTTTLHTGDVSIVVNDTVNVKALAAGGVNLSDQIAAVKAYAKAYTDAASFTAASGALPGQSGSSGMFLTTDGTTAGWRQVQITDISGLSAALATPNSPAITGNPTAPTQTPGDNSTKLATTAFVETATSGLAAVSTTGGTVTLTAAQYGAAIIEVSGTLTSNVILIFPQTSGQWIVGNYTAGAFTVTCKSAAGAGVIVTQGHSRHIFSDGSNFGFPDDYASIQLTGNPTAPTQAAGTSNTTVATTAFSQGALYGRFTNSATYSATSTTWTCPAGVYAVWAKVLGAGGGGGAASSAAGAGGGGGGGGYAEAMVPVTPGTSYSVVAGGGGIASTGISGGGYGGSSSFAGVMTAYGGAGGSGVNGVGSGAAGSGGYFSFSGVPPLWCNAGSQGGAGLSSGGGTASGGMGGSSGIGGSNGNSGNGAGGPAQGYGGGGGGSSGTGGASGAAGLVVLIW